KECSVAAKRAFGVEAKTRNIDISVRSNGQAFDARRLSGRHIWQNRQNVDVAAVPRACRRNCQYPDGKSKRCNDYPTPCHVVPPYRAGAPRDVLGGGLYRDHLTGTMRPQLVLGHAPKPCLEREFLRHHVGALAKKNRRAEGAAPANGPLR